MARKSKRPRKKTGIAKTWTGWTIAIIIVVGAVFFTISGFTGLLVGLNSAPELSIDDASLMVESESTIIYSLPDFASDSDSPPEAISFSITSQTNPDIVNCKIDEDNNLVCTSISPGFSDITIEVTDGIETTAETIRVTVERVAPPEPEEINNPPRITSTPKYTSFLVTRAYAYDVEAEDPEGEEIVFSLLKSPPGMTINPSSGLVQWTPSEIGEHNVVVAATDSSGGTGTQSFVMTPALGVDIIPPEEEANIPAAKNRAPVIIPIGNQTVFENQTFTIQLNYYDPDDDELKFKSNARHIIPSPFTYNKSTRIFTWTPTFNDAGVYKVTYGVTDGEFIEKEVVYITVMDVNAAPQIRPVYDQIVPEGNSLTMDIDADDIDGDSLIFGINAGNVPIPFTFNSMTGVLIWPTTFNDAGEYYLAVRVSDGELSDNERFIITVTDRQPPIPEEIEKEKRPRVISGGGPARINPIRSGGGIKKVDEVPSVLTSSGMNPGTMPDNPEPPAEEVPEAAEPPAEPPAEQPHPSSTPVPAARNRAI